MIKLFVKEKNNKNNKAIVNLTEKLSEEENWDMFHDAVIDTLDLYNLNEAEWLIENAPEINSQYLLREFIMCIVNYGELFFDVYLLVNYELEYSKSIVKAIWKFEDYKGTFDSMEQIKETEHLKNIEKIIIERDNEFHVFKK